MGLVNESELKRKMKELGMQLQGSAIEKLEEKINEIIVDAKERADYNKRKTIMGWDW